MKAPNYPCSTTLRAPLYTLVIKAPSSAYQARVEMKGSVMTAWKSGANPTLEEVKQYHVTSLVKLA